MRTRLAVAALVLFSLGGLAWVVVQSSLLDLEDVEVRGARHTPAEDVRAAAEVERGEPLLLVDRGAVAGRVEELAWVEDARVSWSLPSTLVVTLVERVPVAWVRSGDEPDGEIVIVDREGRILDRRATPPDRLMELAVEMKAGAAGGRVHGGRDALRVAASVPTALRPRIRSLTVTEEGEWRLTVDAADVVRLGPATDLAAKWSALQAVLERLGDRHVHSIDVRAPSVPAVREAPPTTAPPVTTTTASATTASATTASVRAGPSTGTH